MNFMIEFILHFYYRYFTSLEQNRSITVKIDSDISDGLLSIPINHVHHNSMAWHVVSPDSIRLTNRQFAMVQTPVPLDKLDQCQMNRIAFLANPDDLKHAQILQLVQHQLLIEVVGCLLHVGFDASHIPEFMLH
jgi:hypothetical protein